MVKYKRAGVAAVMALVPVLGLAAADAWSNPRVNHVTFSGAVALPGVTLPAGTYEFEVIVPGGAGDVVRVGARGGKHYFMGFTRAIPRPRNVGPSNVIALGEAPAGTPPPVRAWYPVGSARGHEFIYRDR